jgi:hypothetical protein
VLRIGQVLPNSQGNLEILRPLGGIYLAPNLGMLRLLGSIAIGRLLGFGIVGIIVIYLLLRLVS